MQTIMEYAQPYISDAVQALFLLLVSLAFVGLRKIRDKAAELIDARLTDTQRATVHKLAAEAFAFAETAYAGAGGANKLAAAEKYVSDKLQVIGISMSPEEIQSTIHAAWIASGGNIKTSPGTTDQTTDISVTTTVSPEDAAKAAVEAFKVKLADLVEQASADVASASIASHVPATGEQSPTVSADATAAAEQPQGGATTNG